MLGYYKNNLTKYFVDLQYLKNSPDKSELCLSIQESLIKNILTVEKKIRGKKAEIAGLKRKLREKKGGENAKKEAKVCKDAVQLCLSRISFYKDLLSLYHTIGDSIAFIYLCKWDIKPFAFKEKSGFISGQKGKLIEHKHLRQLFKMGHIAVLNDITNSLRYGDITVVTDGCADIIEVKSTNNISAKDEVQLRKIKKIADYLNNDRADELYGRYPNVIRTTACSPDCSHSAILNSLIERSYSEKMVCSKVEKGLWYCVATEYAPDVFDKTINSFKGAPACVFLNASKFEPINAYYPLTLSISNAEALYNFYSGNISIIVLVDLEIIRERFSANGINVTFYEDSEYALKLSKGKGEVRVSRHLFGRIFYEFMSLEWFMEEMIHKIEDTSSGFMNNRE